MNVNQLIELINRCVPGKVRIGRIDLMEKFSFFEVEEKEARRVEKSMNGYELEGRRISVEPAQLKGEDKGKGRKKELRKDDLNVPNSTADQPRVQNQDVRINTLFH